jgi:hypothetical protein
MAFEAACAKAVTDARKRKALPESTPSFDPEVPGWQAVLEEAVRNNRLALAHSVKLLPHDAVEGLTR